MEAERDINHNAHCVGDTLLQNHDEKCAVILGTYLSSHNAVDGKSGDH